jgi:hypothetical protein
MPAKVTKRKKTPIAPVAAPDRQQERRTVFLQTSPLATSAKALQFIAGADDLKLLAVQMEALMDECDAVRRGKLGGLDDMLTAQAHVLNAMFCNFAARMAKAPYVNQTEVYGALALKSQHLCRKTVATLAQMKNPQAVVFIKNNAVNQQVNMAAEIPKNRTNELNAMDGSKAAEASGAHP